MVRGGAAPGRKGSAFECAVVKDQLAAGHAAVRVRQGQGCPFDVIALERCQDGACTLGNALHHVLYVQAKVDGYLLPAERTALLERARADGANPILALPANGSVRYELLETNNRPAARDARER